nr:AAA family ATPase [uncultured Porphyromonas sp.]
MEDKEKKAIIALWGPQGTGKTTTLRKLALEFLDSPEVEEDIQVGFFYKKENSRRHKKKMAMLTTGDDKAVDFAKMLNVKLRVQATEILYLINGDKKTTTLYGELKERLNSDKVIRLRNFLRELLELKECLDLHKTITLCNLLGELQKLKELLNSDETITLSNLLRELLEMKEVDADIQIAFRYKGKKIIISTAGDDEKVIKESIDLSKLMQADILVTAIRAEESPKESSEGSLKGQLEEYTKDIRWIQRKCATSEQDQANEEQVKELQNKIDSIIGIREKE